MEKALEVVLKSQATVSGAAKQFDVPCKTLDDRVKGRVSMGRSLDLGQFSVLVRKISFAITLFIWLKLAFL